MQHQLKHIIFTIWLCIGISAFAQESTITIEGQVFSKEGDVAATHVSNITRNRGTITDENGFFNIAVQLNDTLVFSAVQFKKKEMRVSLEILNSKAMKITLEEETTKLNEVVVMPYNLSGQIDKDLNTLKIGPVITASIEKLPNAHVKIATQSERQLYTARTWDAKFVLIAFTTKLDPIFNYFSGRTKRLNQQVERDAKVDLISQFRKFYSDSLYIKDLRIPQKKINDFVFFCEIDSSFTELVADNDKLMLWEFLKKKSLIYRQTNNLE